MKYTGHVEKLPFLLYASFTTDFNSLGVVLVKNNKTIYVIIG